jgi:hypothetical protein
MLSKRFIQVEPFGLCIDESQYLTVVKCFCQEWFGIRSSIVYQRHKGESGSSLDSQEKCMHN